MMCSQKPVACCGINPLVSGFSLNCTDELTSNNFNLIFVIFFFFNAGNRRSVIALAIVHWSCCPVIIASTWWNRNWYGSDVPRLAKAPHELGYFLFNDSSDVILHSMRPSRTTTKSARFSAIATKTRWHLLVLSSTFFSCVAYLNTQKKKIKHFNTQ